MAPENTDEVQTANSAFNKSQLGSIKEIPTLQVQPVYTRLDKIFWYRQLLSTLCRSRSLDTA